MAAIAILFLGTLVRSSLGFGEALIAVPLLALLMPVDQAAPIAVLVSITIAVVILLQDWRHVHLKSAGRLIASTMLGLPVGLMLLKWAPEALVKGILGSIIFAFSAYMLLHRRGQELKDDRLAWLFGFQAGVLGGAYGMNGPPLAIYGALRRWQPEHFRATLQAYFLPASVAGMAGYWLAGLWTPTVNRIYVESLPAVIAATLAGRAISRWIPAQKFTAVVHVGLIGIGAVLLFQSIAAS
jgi:uncharacterized membrane protein YfcA